MDQAAGRERSEGNSRFARAARGSKSDGKLPCCRPRPPVRRSAAWRRNFSAPRGPSSCWELRDRAKPARGCRRALRSDENEIPNSIPHRRLPSRRSPVGEKFHLAGRARSHQRRGLRGAASWHRHRSQAVDRMMNRVAIRGLGMNQVRFDSAYPMTLKRSRPERPSTIARRPLLGHIQSRSRALARAHPRREVEHQRAISALQRGGRRYERTGPPAQA